SAPTVWSIVQAAGWPIWPLIFASVIALALIFERLWSLRQSVVAPPGLRSERSHRVVHRSSGRLADLAADLRLGHRPRADLRALVVAAAERRRAARAPIGALPPCGPSFKRPAGRSGR